MNSVFLLGCEFGMSTRGWFCFDERLAAVMENGDSKPNFLTGTRSFLTVFEVLCVDFDILAV